jgi:uncharacterized membrane protein YuzA (DUF378 family)
MVIIGLAGAYIQYKFFYQSEDENKKQHDEHKDDAKENLVDAKH